jgi:ribosomal-protein-alanine N-acetyltransferase
MNNSLYRTCQIINQSRSLWLRRTVPEDAKLLFEVGFSQREFMRLFRLNDPCQSVADLYQALVKRQTLPPNQDHYLELLITHKTHGPIGLCALADYTPLHKRAEYLVGLFNSRHRSVGYGIEVTLMVLDLAFNGYGLHKVCAITYDYNQPAQSVLINIGCLQEGRRREHIFDPVIQNFVDLLDFGMTINDFRANNRLARLSQALLKRNITQNSPLLQFPTVEIPRFSPSGPIKL